MITDFTTEPSPKTIDCLQHVVGAEAVIMLALALSFQGVASEVGAEVMLTDWPTALAFSQGGAVLYSGDYGGAVKAWDVTEAKPKRLKVYQGSEPRGNSTVLCLAASADGMYLAASFLKGRITVWDVSTGQEADSFDLGLGRGPRIAFSPAGSRLLCSKGGRLILRDITLRNDILDAALCKDNICAVSFSQDGSYIAVATAGDEVLIVDPPKGELIRRASFLTKRGEGPGVSPSNTWSGDDDNDPDRIRAVCWLPDGKTVLVGQEAGIVRFLDATTGRALGRVEVADSLQDISVPNDGKVMAFISFPYGLGIVDIAQRKERPKLSSLCCSVTISGDGQRLAVGGYNKRICLFHSPFSAQESLAAPKAPNEEKQ